ncbi:MAG: caspase [Cyanothece sp. SIO1E1]|nr:caspase [Cyanothece sp. SIO1E1]
MAKMVHSLYALLVGINEYAPESRVRSLRGCVNDVKAMKAYLEGRVAQDTFKLHLKTLVNNQATRENVIQGFRTHLCQAGSEDVALFFYAGHGAQAFSPKAFGPDRQLETLVCYDSRVEGHWDIADKELAQLIAEVDGENHPHIVCIFDSCHSGSATRGKLEKTTISARLADEDKRQRPLESFINFDSESNTIRKILTGRHTVLSACRNIEEAYEYREAQEPRGIFSYFLLESLQKANGSLSYRDLSKRTNVLVRNRFSAQSPQLEATDSEDRERPFLGGAIASFPRYFTVSYDAHNHGWVIDGGRIHGLVPPTRNEATETTETTVLALFPFDASADRIRQLQDPIAKASVTEVLPQLSTLDISPTKADSPLPTAETFKAVIVSLPLPPMKVYLEGDEDGLELVKEALATAGPDSKPSLYVQGIDSYEGADYRVLVRNGEYWITTLAEERPLVEQRQGYSKPNAQILVKDLEHIALWTTIAELKRPVSSEIQGAVQIQLYSSDDKQELTDTQLRMDYSYNLSKKKWEQPAYRVKLKNNTNKILWCALLSLEENFKVTPLQLDGVDVVKPLPPSGEIWLVGKNSKGQLTDKLVGAVPKELWKGQGITEWQDTLKLIACTNKFEPKTIELPALGFSLPTPEVERSLGKTGTLNKLMQRSITRAGYDLEDEETYDDWITDEITLTYVRPLESQPIQNTTPTNLGSSVTLQPHAKLKANACLMTVPQATRSLDNQPLTISEVTHSLKNQVLPTILAEETEPLEFTNSRGTNPGLSVLELNNVENPEVVTAENPLVVETDLALENDEYILPIAYDGEFYIPLGYGKAQKGKARIVIERLSEQLSEPQPSSRSIQGSIRILFQKIISRKLGKGLSQKLGLIDPYPILAAVEVKHSQDANKSQDNYEVIYLRDIETVKAKVAKAQKIALYIHGILGDTESMIPSIERAMVKLTNEMQPISKLYDLILACDYENILAKIDDNAQDLKQRLNAVGLGPNHGKELHIIAHSMGGLVSRWFIEQEDGNKVVQHLIMLGTPNGGSPWPEVQAGITAAVTLAINGLSIGFPPLKIFGSLLAQIEKVDNSLDQMEPSSKFLKKLVAASDPGIPYTIVAGNTSLIPEDETAPLKKKLLRKLGNLVELPFFNQPNDIAVSVKSIANIPPGRNPEPLIIPVACNHLVYFKDPAGLAALADAVTGTNIYENKTTGN